MTNNDKNNKLPPVNPIPDVEIVETIIITESKDPSIFIKSLDHLPKNINKEEDK